MNKTTEIDIQETREKLVKVIFAMQRQAKKRDQLKELLEEDFEDNAEEYLRGVETKSGYLVRRPHGFDLLARPIANADEKVEA